MRITISDDANGVTLISWLEKNEAFATVEGALDRIKHLLKTKPLKTLDFNSRINEFYSKYNRKPNRIIVLRTDDIFGIKEIGESLIVDYSSFQNWLDEKDLHYDSEHSLGYMIYGILVEYR